MSSQDASKQASVSNAYKEVSCQVMSKISFWNKWVNTYIVV